jgi:hypothetical protein
MSGVACCANEAGKQGTKTLELEGHGWYKDPKVEQA